MKQLPDVFLCHNSKERKFVRRLAKDLERLAVRPWFDTWELKPGDSLLEKIGEGINESSFFCIVLTKNSADSNWCKNELREALTNSITNGRNNIIVIRYGEVNTPPFLKDNLHIAMSRYSLKAVLQIAGRIHGISARAVDEFSQSSDLSDIGSVSNFILAETSDRRIRFGSDEWKALSDILKQRGISISDNIDIFDHGTGKKFPVA
jgi:TIR domain